MLPLMIRSSALKSTRMRYTLQLKKSRHMCLWAITMIQIQATKLSYKAKPTISLPRRIIKAKNSTPTAIKVNQHVTWSTPCVSFPKALRSCVKTPQDRSVSPISVHSPVTPVCRPLCWVSKVTIVAMRCAILTFVGSVWLVVFVAI